MAEGNSDIEKELLIEEDQADEDLSTNERFMDLLSKMNDNICALGVSLNKRQHESIVSDQSSTNTAVSAKKAKTCSLSESVPDNESDSEALLRNDEQGHPSCNENTSEDDEQQAANMADVDDPLLEEIAQSLDETERKGDPVSDKLALIANKRWNHKLSDDQLKEKTEKYLRPANCDKVVSPRVNPEIWAKLSRAVRSDDHKLFRVQNLLSTVTNLVVKATDALLKAKSDPKRLKIDDLVRMSTDAVALISHASYELQSWPKLCGHQLAQVLFAYKSHPHSPQTMLMP